MAKFQVNKLCGRGPIRSLCYQENWWNPWNWTSVHWRDMDCGGHAYVMIGNTMVKELKGKIADSSYIFECEAPDGDVWVICVDGAVCEVERLS